MARAYSQDLRDRVIDAALAGLPARHAAARVGIGDPGLGWTLAVFHFAATVAALLALRRRG